VALRVGANLPDRFTRDDDGVGLIDPADAPGSSLKLDRPANGGAGRERDGSCVVEKPKARGLPANAPFRVPVAAVRRPRRVDRFRSDEHLVAVPDASQPDPRMNSEHHDRRTQPRRRSDVVESLLESVLPKNVPRCLRIGRRAITDGNSGGAF
jgi:hypothetical protein